MWKLEIISVENERNFQFSFLPLVRSYYSTSAAEVFYRHHTKGNRHYHFRSACRWRCPSCRLPERPQGRRQVWLDKISTNFEQRLWLMSLNEGSERDLGGPQQKNGESISATMYVDYGYSCNYSRRSVSIGREVCRSSSANLVCIKHFNLKKKDWNHLKQVRKHLRDSKEL